MRIHQHHIILREEKMKFNLFYTKHTYANKLKSSVIPKKYFILTIVCYHARHIIHIYKKMKANLCEQKIHLMTYHRYNISQIIN